MGYKKFSSQKNINKGERILKGSIWSIRPGTEFPQNILIK